MSDDFYTILGVSREASQEEIKKAYRKQAHKYHPDRGGDEEQFKKVNEAYQVLGDEDKRRQYDQFGSAGGAQGNPFGGAQGNPFGFGGQAGGFEFDMGDIFEQFFGGGGQSADRSRARRGRDIEAAIEVSLTDIYLGAEKELSFETHIACDRCEGKQHEPGSTMKTCSTCGGVGKVKQERRTILGMVSNVQACGECYGAGETPERKCTECYGEGRKRDKRNVTVKIPAGIGLNERVRVSDAGEAGIGGATGDLYVRPVLKQKKRVNKKAKKLLEELREEGL